MNKHLKAAYDQAEYWRRAYEIEHERRLRAAEERRRDIYNKVGDAVVVLIYAAVICGSLWSFATFVGWLCGGWR